MEKVILLFREQGITGERLQIQWQDWDLKMYRSNFADDLLSRKEENIKAQKHLRRRSNLLKSASGKHAA